VKSIKTLGLVAVMALALTAVVGVGAASASEFRSEAASTTWNITAINPGANLQLGASGGFSNCGNDLSGSTTSTSSPTLLGRSVYVTSEGKPSFTCNWLSQPATWTMGSCEYRFRPGGESLVGFVDLTKCGKEEMFWSAGGCKLTLGNQKYLSSVTYKNIGAGSKREILASADLKGITYTAAGAGCFGSTGTYSTGTYKIEWKLSGTSAGKQVGVWAESSPLPAPTVFAAEEAPVTIAGKIAENKAIFQTGANGSVLCSEHQLSGSSATTTSTSIALSASYKGCEFLGQPATMSMGGCSYVYRVNGGFDLVGATCASNPVTFSAAGCTVTIGPKSGLTGLTYSNSGLGVRTAGEASGLTSTVTGVGCIATGSFATIYKSKDTLSATNSSGKPQGFAVE
jgi:hypothetical protein